MLSEDRRRAGEQNISEWCELKGRLTYCLQAVNPVRKGPVVIFLCVAVALCIGIRLLVPVCELRACRQVRS
jgi:hypothetical protein